MNKQGFSLGTTRAVRIGYSLYTSLPIRWVENVGLKKGDLLEIHLDKDGGIIVTPKEGSA